MNQTTKDSVSPVEADTERNDVDKTSRPVSLFASMEWAFLGASGAGAYFSFLNSVPCVYHISGCLLVSVGFYYLAARSDAHD